jgi:hypothetical protein
MHLRRRSFSEQDTPKAGVQDHPRKRYERPSPLCFFQVTNRGLQQGEGANRSGPHHWHQITDNFFWPFICEGSGSGLLSSKAATSESQQ